MPWSNNARDSHFSDFSYLEHSCLCIFTKVLKRPKIIPPRLQDGGGQGGRQGGEQGGRHVGGQGDRHVGGQDG